LHLSSFKNENTFALITKKIKGVDGVYIVYVLCAL
jgi:hypothetical protein